MVKDQEEKIILCGELVYLYISMKVNKVLGMKDTGRPGQNLQDQVSLWQKKEIYIFYFPKEKMFFPGKYFGKASWKQLFRVLDKYYQA